MAITQRYGRTQNQALLVEIEAAEGVLETPDAATQAVPIEPFQVPLNPNVIESNEATGSIIRGRRVVTRLDPRLTAVSKMRGSGTLGTNPRQAPLLQVGGMAFTNEARLPSGSDVFDVASGTTTTIVIDRTAGTGTQLPSTTATLRARLVGLAMTLSVNPSTARTVIITDATITGSNVTITFREPLASAADNTTEAVILQQDVARPTTTIPTISAWGYRDGKLIKLAGCRGRGSLAMPGGERPTYTVDLAGRFDSESDASVPAAVDFSGLPAEPLFRNGIAVLGGKETGCSNFTLDHTATDTRYPNPNQLLGLDQNIITALDPQGVVTLNDKLVAFHDIKSDLINNTLMPIVMCTDRSAAAASRFAATVPNALLLDVQDGDREGLHENQVPYQCVNLAGGFPAFIYSFF